MASMLFSYGKLSINRHVQVPNYLTGGSAGEVSCRYRSKNPVGGSRRDSRGQAAPVADGFGRLHEVGRATGDGCGHHQRLDWGRHHPGQAVEESEMKQLILDTNVLVRFLVQDNARQGAAAAKLMNDAQSGVYELLLDRMVVAELVYVLMSHYKRPRVDVANTVLAIVRSPYVRVEQEPELVEALLRFRDHSVDFVDAWLAARGARGGQEVVSFDRDLDRFADVTRFEPK